VSGVVPCRKSSGAKSWALRFRSPVERGKDGQRAARKLTLGTAGALSLVEARSLATAALADVERGIDPTHTKRKEKITDSTVGAVMVEFLQRYKGRKQQGLRDSTRDLTAMYFGLKRDGDQWKATGNGVLGHWSGWALASITKVDAILLLDRLVDRGHAVTANRTLTNLKCFFSWCVKRDMLASSPVALLDKPAPERSRERVLTDTELAAVWKAAQASGHIFGAYVQLLVLTAARRDELREATWNEFDLGAGTWLLPAGRSKNGHAHLTPLSPAAMTILRAMPRIGHAGLLFTRNGVNAIGDISRMKRRLDAAAGVTGWTLHDLRRTVASGLQRAGFSLEVVEAILNHKSGTLRGVAGIYARHDYLAEKTKALKAWAQHVVPLVARV